MHVDLNWRFPESITPHSSWLVLDSTKIQEYLTCPREFFYRYVLGWVRDVEPRNDLAYGEAMHLSLEYLLLHGNIVENVPAAYQLFLDKYREYFPPESDDSFGVKTPANALYVLGMYVQEFPENPLVLETEIAGSVHINMPEGKEPDSIFFKMDAICQDQRGIYSMEHKTTKSIHAKYINQWILKTQICTYTHALHCMYQRPDIYGVIVNALEIKAPPRIKANGEPYANSVPPNFARAPIPKTADMMNVWLWWINKKFQDIQSDFIELTHATDGRIMKCFEMNTESCSKYWGCTFHDFCLSWANPIQHCHMPPPGFKVKHWNPKDKQETAKKVVTL